jgi:hypothetical protein
MVKDPIQPLPLRIKGNMLQGLNIDIVYGASMHPGISSKQSLLHIPIIGCGDV